MGGAARRQHLQTGGRRQLEIGQHQVEASLGQPLHAGLAVGRGDHLVALGGERPLEHQAQRLPILHQQDATAGHAGAP